MAALTLAQTPSPGSASGVEGVITLGPIHGGPVREGVPSSAPVANKTFVVTGEKGAATEFTTDDQGHFRISLAPGHYSVALKEGKIGIRRSEFGVDVAAGQMTKVNWHCDTGMR